jgi:hypothetical protein
MNLQSLKKILESGSFTIVVVLLAIAGRLMQVLFFHGALFDNLLQVSSMQQLVAGHGISLPTVTASDLSEIFYLKLGNWPPGYALLQAPVYILTGNYILSAILLDIAAAISIIFISRKMLTVLNVPLYLRNLYTIPAGFFIYYFYFIGSADSIGIAFYLTALLLMLRSIKEQGRKIFYALSISSCLFAAASIKFLFWPLVFIIPAVILLHGYYHHSSFEKKLGWLTGIFTAAAVIMLLIYQLNTSGSAGYISAEGRGFFPGHIKDAYPFIPASFASLSLLERLNAGSLWDVWKVIHLLILVILIVLAYTWLSKIRRADISLKGTFLLTSLVIALSISAVLLFLSLRIEKEEIMPGYFWTYLQDGRYYGLAEILLHLCIFIVIAKIYSSAKPRKLALATLLLVFLLPETTRGILFSANRLARLGKENYYWQDDLLVQKLADSIINKKKLEKQVNDAVVSSDSYYTSMRISVYSKLPVLDPSVFMNSTKGLRSKKPVLVFLAVSEKHIESFSQSAQFQNMELAGRDGDLYFYTLYVPAS